MQKKLLTALAAAGVCALLAGVALQERGGRSPAALLATQKLYGYYPYPYGSAGGGGYPYGGGYGGGYPGEKHRPVLLHHAQSQPKDSFKKSTKEEEDRHQKTEAVEAQEQVRPLCPPPPSSL